MRIRDTFIRFRVLSNRLVLMAAGVYLKRQWKQIKLQRDFAISHPLRYEYVYRETLFLTTRRNRIVIMRPNMRNLHTISACARSPLLFSLFLFWSIAALRRAEIVFYVTERENIKWKYRVDWWMKYAGVILMGEHVSNSSRNLQFAIWFFIRKMYSTIMVCQ